MRQILAENPILLLFTVAATGYLIGKIKLGKSSLGVAAVLFTGLVFGAIDPNFSVPEIVFQLGLVFFVYSIGLNSGPAFFKLLNKNGLKQFAFFVGMLTVMAAITGIVGYQVNFSRECIIGIFSGSTTNTPALAAVINFIQNQGQLNATELMQDAVVAYSFTYPMGVIGVLMAIVLMEKILKINYIKDVEDNKNDYPIQENLTNKTISIQSEDVIGKSLRDIKNAYNWDVVFGRVKRKGKSFFLANWDTVLEKEDWIMVIGNAETLEEVSHIMGKSVDVNLSYDRKEYDIRRIFVSNPAVVGQSVSSLNLSENYDAVITRIRRGDLDMLAKGDTVLELGDRIRFVARRSDMKELSKYFGDSYYESSKADLFSFGLGIAIGLLIGLIEIPLPGGISFKLGIAGGPLLVSIILSSLRRTGPIVWSLPYSTNVALRQIGLILLLSVIGLKSGNAFIQSIYEGDALSIFGFGAAISFLSACFALLIGYKVIKIPFSIMMGFVSNQPAILDFAMSRSGNRLPIFGYTLMFPISLILKIIYAQVLYLVLA